MCLYEWQVQKKEFAVHNFNGAANLAYADFLKLTKSHDFTGIPYIFSQAQYWAFLTLVLNPMHSDSAW